MIVVRDIFQAKYGKGGELVQLFKEAEQRWDPMHQYGRRILTDLSGPFFTVVTETEVESLEQYQHWLQESFTHPDFGAWFARMEPLVESGHREFYTVEAPS